MEAERRIDALDEPGESVSDLDNFEPPSSVPPIHGVDGVDLVPPSSEDIPDTVLAATQRSGVEPFEDSAESGERLTSRAESSPIVTPISVPVSKPSARDLPPYVASVLEPTEEQDTASQRKQQEAA